LGPRETVAKMVQSGAILMQLGEVLEIQLILWKTSSRNTKTSLVSLWYWTVPKKGCHLDAIM